MIKAKFNKNQNGDVYSFKIENHGAPIVCSAVSLLSLNAINSIEEFTEQPFKCKVKGDGFLSFECKPNDLDKDAALLLNSLLLGLQGIAESYPDDIELVIELS